MKNVSHVVMLLIAIAATPSAAGEFHVAPDGSDGNSGERDKPFASIARARDVVRQAKATSEGPITVWVHGGVYRLEKTLDFGPEDSGTEKAPIVYAAAEGQKTVISGGRPITGWTPYRDKIWQCDLKTLGLKEPHFRELYYNGRRQPLARAPNVDPLHPRTGGFLYVADGGEKGSRRRLKYDPAKLDPSKWAHPKLAEVDVFSYHNWDNNIVPIVDIDTANHVITLAQDASYELVWDTRFYVRNVFEELDAPGEWYLDEEAGMLYFWPPDEGLAQAGVIVPMVDAVIEIKGDAARKAYVQYLEIRGFTIGACRGTAVSMDAVQHCTIAKNTIMHVGQGVWLGSQSEYNRVVGNDVADVGSGAVEVGGSHNTVSNNHIHDVGVLSRGSSPLGIAGQANVISHNLLHDVPSLGINFGGGDHVVEYNDIHHFGLETNVPGGIYSYGSKEQPDSIGGVIIRFNKISDGVGYGMMSHPGQEVGKWGPNFGVGVWLDDWVSRTTVYGNILVRNRGVGVVIHGGTDNVVENNIMGTGISAGINHLRPGPEPCNNKFVRNIVYYANTDPKSLWLYGWTREAEARAVRGDAIPVSICGWTIEKAAVSESDYNLLFPIRGKDVDALYCFRGAAPGLVAGPWIDAPVSDRFVWWRQQGFEAHSVVGDPLFVDSAHDDYRLRPESPVFKLGFKPIPVDKIGLEPTADRATWPVENHQDIWREQPEENPTLK